MKKIIFSLMALMLLVSFVSAHSDEEFAQAEALIEQKVSCDDLTEEQLELIGDYYMEQMHPGEAHEYMDTMMGGEGSESLRLMHINMALRIYCNETNYGGYGMMGMMPMMTGYGGMGYNYQSNYGFNWLMPLALVLIIMLLAVLIFKQKK